MHVTKCSYKGIDGGPVVMCFLAKLQSGDDHAITTASQTHVTLNSHLVEKQVDVLPSKN